MFVYKIDLLTELKKAGYSTIRLRKENILGQASIQNIREGKVIGINALDKVCGVLKKQPSSIIKWVPDEE